MSWSQIAAAAIPAVVSAGAGLYTANTTAKANQRAAQQTADAIGQAADTTQQGNEAALQYLREGRDQANEYLAPYREGGAADYSALRQLIGTDYQQSPGYQFAFDEGQRAVNNRASATGTLNSGARQRELVRFGTGIAQQDYGNWLSRLQGLAGAGQTATGQAASLTANAGGQQAQTTQQGTSALSNLMVGQGQAQAQGTVGQANALLGGINQAAGLYSLLR